MSAESEVVILDPALEEFAGNPAWRDIAWTTRGALERAEAIRAEMQREQEEAEMQRRLERYLHSLPRHYHDYTEELLDTHDGNREAVERATALEPGENLFLYGAAGNGKTHLAVATGFRLLGTCSVAFYGVVGLFNRIRDSFNGGPPRPDLLEPDVLIFDDLGKVKPTEFVYQEFYGAVEGRWGDKKTTIFTANHRASVCASDLARDEEGAAAILSRMASGVVVEVRGDDRRLRG